MNRPLSQLIYTRIQDGEGTPRIITMHGHNQHGGDVRAFGIAANPAARVIGLQSYKGVFLGQQITGYTWFIGPFEQPSPLFFGDALAEIERFLWDEIDRQEADRAELPFLIGVEQGAIMALATAAAIPDLLSGVIAIGGSLPIVPGWEPPLVPLEGLPILLVDAADSRPQRPDVLTGTALAATLRAWGGIVTHVDESDLTVPSPTMATWLNAQSVQWLAKTDETEAR